MSEGMKQGGVHAGKEKMSFIHARTYAQCWLTMNTLTVFEQPISSSLYFTLILSKSENNNRPLKKKNQIRINFKHQIGHIIYRRIVNERERHY